MGSKGKNKAGVNFEIILPENTDKTKPDGYGCITFGMFCHPSANFYRTSSGEENIRRMKRKIQIS
jgi:hypothetical protein